MNPELSFILDKSTSAICYTDSQNKFLYVNKAFCDLFQESREQLIGNNFDFLFPYLTNQEINPIYLQYKKALELNEEIKSEQLLILKSGKRLVLEMTASIFNDSDRGIIVVSLIDDITYFRDSEIALIQVNKKLYDLQFAVNQSSIVSVTDPNGVITDINENFSKISGYTRNELIGKKHNIINSNYHSNYFFKDMWLTITSGKVWYGEIRNKRKNGDYYWVYAHIIPFLDEEGNIIQYLSIRSDITVRKSAEALLAASEEKYRLLYQKAPIGIVIVGLDLKIIDCNDYILELLGFSKPEFVGEYSLNFVHPDFIEYKMIAVNKLFNKEIDRFYVEEQRKTKENKYIWVGVYSNAIKDSNGNVVYRLDFVIDIENRKRTEEEIIKIDDAKNAIINIVAHDLRSPISGIIGLVNLMLSEEQTEINRRYLEMIDTSSHHALSITHDILEMNELRLARTLEGKEPIELNQFLLDCIQFQDLQAKEKSIDIIFISKVEKLYADINRDKIRRVITNLISNSIKFTKEKGKIELSLSLKDKHPFITIRDNGIGIPKNKQPYLFEKFSAARRIGTKGEKSTGLGMFIVKEIIDKHGGRITFESEENQGTTFYLEL